MTAEITKNEGDIMIDFELKQLKSYSTICPRCSSSRTKKNQKSLMIHRDEDKKIRIKCFHSADCEYGNWTTFDDPDTTTDFSKSDSSVNNILYPIPADIDLPDSWHGSDTIHWYRNAENEALFGIIRWKRADGSKTFAPLVLLKTGEWKGGAGASYPNIKTLYGIEHLKNAKKVLIVEGEKAADAGNKLLNDRGYAVVTWRGGANNVKQQPWELLKHFKDITIWPDNDSAGISAAHEIASLLQVAQVKILNVSHLATGSDIADNHSAEDIRRAFENATVIKTNHKCAISLEEIMKMIEVRQNFTKTGFEVIDSRIRLPASGVFIVEGRTGHGKSTLAVALAVNWLKAGKRVVFMSYEEPADRLLSRFVKNLNPDLDNFETHLAPEFKVFEEYITSGQLEIYDQEAQINADSLIKTFDSDYYRDALVIVDNAQIVPFSNSYNMSRHVAIKEQLMDPLRILANRRGFVGLVLSQVTPNEMRPEADAPRDCKDIHMAAEVVFRVWNKEDFADHPFLNFIKGNYAIQVKKNRSGEAHLVFDCKKYGGSKLEVNGILEAKTVRSYLNKAKRDRSVNVSKNEEDIDAF